MATRFVPKKEFDAVTAQIQRMESTHLRTLTRKYDFCMGHRLLNYDGACNRLHGHNITAEVFVKSDYLDERGIMVDFLDLDKVLKTFIDENWDHRMILNGADPLWNEVNEHDRLTFFRMPMDQNPTMENLAVILQEYLFEYLPIPPSATLEVHVKLWESNKSSCEV